MLTTTRTYDIYDFNRTRSYRLQPNSGFTFERALTTFTRSDNSAESEPIWMKSRALWVHCLVLAIGDFCRDPRSSEGWRARRIFFVRKATHDFTDFPSAKFHEIRTTHWSLWRWILLEQNYENFPVGIVFPKKCKTMNFFQRRATLSCYNDYRSTEIRYHFSLDRDV